MTFCLCKLGEWTFVDVDTFPDPRVEKAKKPGKEKGRRKYGANILL